MEDITREINWNVQSWMLVFLYAGAALAIGYSLLRLYRRVRVWREGAASDLDISFGRAVSNVLNWIAGRGKMNRDPYAGVMHWLILWGFIILFIGTTLVFLEHQTPLHFFYGPFYLVSSLIIDLGGVLFLVGLGMAVHRRFIKRKERLKTSGWVDGMLALMILIGISGFVLEAARIGVSFPEFEVVSFVGYGLALAFRGMGLQSGGMEALHQGTWVTHAAFSIGFFGVATVYFFRHIVVSMLSVALKPERPWGQLRPYTVSEEADSEVPGTPKHVTWKDLLDADACTQCGRCTSVCPATQAGKALDPRNVVLKLSSLVDRRLDSNGSTPSAFEEVADQELWDCTTCGACVSECPVDIEVYQKIIDLRRNLVELGRVPQEAGESLDGVANRANPWNRPPGQRMAWAGTSKPPVVNEEHTPEIIYWIGCAGAYEPDGQSVTKSVIDIMKQAGLDFAVLGSGERCTGDPARRVGDEALFQEYKAKNLETLHNAGAKRVVTHCPHCFNTFKNEYQDENNPLEFEVIHHSQLIDELIKESKIELEREQKEQITFHDPCYLGRHNGEYDAPRNVLGSLPGISSTEMERSKRSSFCCGGGGGQMWLRQEGASEQVENIRLKEAEGTGAQTVATGCPFCKIMFQGSSRRAQQESPQQIKDISELVSERMKR